MKRNFKIFWLFSTSSLKATLQHPLGIVFFTFGKVVRFVMFLFLVIYLLKNTRTLAGYSLEKILIFFLTFNIIDTLSQLLFREVYRFRSLVVSGELDSVLVKPYNPFLRVLVGGVDFLDLLMLLPYIGLLFWFMIKANVGLSVGLVLYIALLVNAMLISTGFHILVLSLGILTTEVDHTIMIYRDIARLGIMPIDIYREPLKTIFTFIIPVGIMLTFPAKALFNLLSWKFVLLSFVFGFGTLMVGLISWHKALQKYQSWGG